MFALWSVTLTEDSTDVNVNDLMIEKGFADVIKMKLCEDRYTLLTPLRKRTKHEC